MQSLVHSRVIFKIFKHLIIVLRLSFYKTNMGHSPGSSGSVLSGSALRNLAVSDNLETCERSEAARPFLHPVHCGTDEAPFCGGPMNSVSRRPALRFCESQ